MAVSVRAPTPPYPHPAGLAPEHVVFTERGMVPGPGGAYNIQRPEALEAFFMLWRVTGKPMYREWAWSVFQAFDRQCKARRPPARGPRVPRHKLGLLAGHACRAGSHLSGNPALLRAEQVPDSGYAGVRDVTAAPVELDDTMQSFWLAETLKYAWLTFSPPDALDLRTRVLNTEVRGPPL